MGGSQRLRDPVRDMYTDMAGEMFFEQQLQCSLHAGPNAQGDIRSCLRVLRGNTLCDWMRTGDGDDPGDTEGQLGIGDVPIRMHDPGHAGILRERRQRVRASREYMYPGGLSGNGLQHRGLRERELAHY